MSLVLSRSAMGRRINVDRILTFWLPVIVLAVLVLRNDARIEYAEAAAGSSREYLDLALDANAGNFDRQVLFLTFGSMGAFLLWRDRRLARRAVFWPIPLLGGLLLAYACCSVVWSDGAFLTVKRIIVMSCAALGAISIGKLWSIRDLCLAIVGWCSLFLIVGVAAELASGTFMSGGEYRFSGVFHPNKQVFVCAFLFIASSCMFQTERRRIFLLIAAIAFAGVVLTKSRGGTAACLLAGAWLWWNYFPRRSLITAMVAGSIVVSMGMIALGVTGKDVSVRSLARMGRSDELADPTKLTGRLPIWTETLAAFSAQPILGFGYGAFWSPERIRYFESQNGWAFSHAHSIYLESAVNLGIIGVCIIFVLVVVAGRRCIYLLHTDHRMAARWTIAVIILAAISGIAESTFVAAGFETVLLFASFSFIAFHGPVSAARRVR